MSKSKIIVLTGLMILAFCISTIGNAVAGERVKCRTVKYTVKIELVDVGDEERRRRC